MYLDKCIINDCRPVGTFMAHSGLNHLFHVITVHKKTACTKYNVQQYESK